MSVRHPWLIGMVAGLAVLGSISLVHFDEMATTMPVARDSQPEQTVDPMVAITALPTSIQLDRRKLVLGERLFHDPRLSADGTVSCAHCHNLSTGGVDHLPRSRGVGNQEGLVNAPTVFNSGFNFRQFWDGRARTLEIQVSGPLENPREMANSWPKALATLAEDHTYRVQFATTYTDGITATNVKDAIATFERSLITPNAGFDLFLRGNLSVLNEEEKAGYRLFKQIGCTSCHQGMNIGGNMYQKLGIVEDYFAGRITSNDADLGRFNQTHLEEDRHFFRVPSLRNVAVTAPYLHDASAATLEDTVKIMARYQLGRHLEPKEVMSIVAFLGTLTGEYLGKPLQ